MNLDDMTIGQGKELASMFGGGQVAVPAKAAFKYIGKHVIIRTYSAGVWFGVLSEKDGSEVILADARRMYKWWAADSISLSACAIHGIKRDKSGICEGVESVWLEAIEIIPCTEKAIESIGGADNVAA